MTEALDFIRVNWLESIAAIFMAAMFVYGYKKGLIRMSVSFVSIVISLVCTKLILPYARSWAIGNVRLNTWINHRVNAILFSSGADTASGNLPDAAAVDQSKGIVNQNIDLFYQMIGLDRFTDFLADKISSLIITILLFIALSILIHLVVRIVLQILDYVMRAPGLNMINRTLGGMLGIVQAILYIWVLMILIGILPESPITIGIGEQISRPGWLNYLKEANVITRIFRAMIGA